MVLLNHMDKQTVIQVHFKDLQKIHPDFEINVKGKEFFSIQGSINFSVEYNEISIADGFRIKILIPENYPDKPPSVQEINGRIPGTFHTNGDGTLCLGPPLEVGLVFAEEPNLVAFVTKLVIPYLFSFCYWEKFGEMPFGEYSHGGKGILEHYKKLLNISDEIVIFDFLRILAKNNYKGHHACPCGSGNKLRHCHGRIIMEIINIQNQENFIFDIINSLSYIKNTGKEIPGQIVQDKLLFKLIKKTLRKLNLNDHEQLSQKRI